MPKLSFQTASSADIQADVLVLPVFRGPEAGPGVKEATAALGTDLLELYRSNRLVGRLGQSLAVPTLGKLESEMVMLVGLGRREVATSDTLRRGIGRIAPRLATFARVATTLPQAIGRGGEDSVQATVEGLLLGSYRFDRYKIKDEKAAENKPSLKEVIVLGSARANGAGVKAALERARILSESVAWARDLVNMPALDATPEFLAAEARRMAKQTGLQIKVWSQGELDRGGFGGIVGVGRGSTNPPRLIELTYRGAGSGRPYALTGKGVTFDSGGLSIKSAAGMEWMKSDMGGAAAVLGAMRAIALLKPRINVIAAVPCAENLPSGTAIRPGDILRHRGGRTSEVVNTDAEGRLILADALAYLTEKDPVAVIDCATLTGAAVVALGDEISAVFGNDRELVSEVLAAGEAVGEPSWELPLWRNYRKQIESPIADVKNVGGRNGGAITAALFLKEFVGDTPWVHMDVAGAAFSDSPGDYWPKGASGVPARTLVRFVMDRAGTTARTTARRVSGDGARKASTRRAPAKRSASRSTSKKSTRKATTRRR